MEIKNVLLRISIEHLEEEIEDIQKSIDLEHSSLIDSPSAMQSWSDTTRSQKEDLINGLKIQLTLRKKLLSSLINLKVVSQNVVQLGSLVQLVNNNIIENYYLIPSNSTKPIIVNAIVYHIISPQSLIAKSLNNHIIGDTVEFIVPAGKRIFTIVKIE